MRRLRFLFVVALAACSPHATLGRVTSAGKDATAPDANTVSVTRAGKHITYQPGMNLEPGDTIATGAGASAIINVATASVAMADSTDVTLLLEGFFTRVGEVFISGWLGTETKLATAGVEGTEYVVSVDEVTGITTVSVLEGHVRLTARDAPSRTILLQPRQQSTVDARTEPLVATPIAIERFNALVAFENLVQERSREPLLPDLRGTSREYAERELGALGVRAEIGEQKVTDAALIDAVIDQEPAAGTRARQVKLRVGKAMRSAAGTTRGSAVIRAPVSIAAGADIEFSWTGPNHKQDMIVFVPARTGPENYDPALSVRADNPSPAKLPGLLPSGLYELRYLQQGLVLARKKIVVTPVTATVRGPRQVEAGAEFQLTWAGPNNASDYVVIVPATDADGTIYNGLSIKASQAQPALWRAPSQPGDYELRYHLQGKTFDEKATPVIARWKLTVISSSASVSGPAEVEAASEFEIVWSGPQREGDKITLVESGAADNSYYHGLTVPADAARRATMRAPAQAGTYELRYFAGGAFLRGRQVPILARHTIRVIAATASFRAQKEVQAGSDFSVSWDGPNHPADSIHIVPVDARPGTYRDAPYSASGEMIQPATLRAPAKPGDYELRYLLDGLSPGGAVIIARAPISITPASASLTAPPTVKAGSEMKIMWSGPNRASDTIQLVPSGTPDGHYFSNLTLAGDQNNAGVLRAPATPGSYELRYALQAEEIIARRTVTVIKP